MSDLQNIAGPLLISLFLNSGFYGILSVQVYLYYLAFPNDEAWVKCLIYGVFIVETFQTAYFTETVFNTIVSGFLNPALLDKIGPLWFIVPVITGIVTFVSQAFYVYRINALGGSKVVGAIIAFLAVAQLGGSVVVGVEMRHVKRFSRLLDRGSKLVVAICGGSSVLCDLIIAVSMTYLLARSIDQVKGQTRKRLRKLVRLSIETGSLTAIMAILNIMLVVVPMGFKSNSKPGSMTPAYYQTTATVLSKMYANTLVVMLNSRMEMRANRKLEGEVTEVESCSSMEFTWPSSFVISTGTGSVVSQTHDGDSTNLTSKVAKWSGVDILECIPE
ncbi:hypothetical protein GALMADRAFT_1256721 [Galerina marginata CBS 339.88]|uniref:DUF6534 domain-containing protein n=1 Tax=Galerina marginata (strain CBS 339.88) TaxID=685588 RepID=A0A067THX4_GALM3|nr:hypothetical protein GALMADRAFT_1256721 [Galerina marginata CBS 339.88]